MAFQSLQFQYTPPATITQPVTTQETSVDTTKIQPTKAKDTIKALNDLIETSQYIQNLIVNKYSNTGITIDPTTDPATAQALAACYNGSVPPVITTGMYNNLLDCQFALQSIDSATGINSSIEADPVMLSNVIQINTAVAGSLLDDGGADQLAIQSLAILKGDSLIFSNIAASLLVYDVGTDLSPSVSSNLDTLIANESALLASLYSLQTDVNVINADVNNVLNAYFYQPLEDIVRVTAAINLLKSLSFKKEAKKIVDGLTTIIYSRLLSDVATHYFAADQIVQRILTPLRSMTGVLGSVLNTVNKTVKSVETATNLAKTTATTLSKNGLTGFSNCNPCSQKVLKNMSGTSLPNVPGFDGLSSGLQFLGQHISAAQSSMNSKFAEIESTFIALQKRRNKDFSDVLQLMCGMQAAESLINIGNQVISQQKSTSPAISGVTTPAGSLSTIINNLNLSSNPATSTTSMPANVSNVLTAGGLTNGVISA